MNLPESVIYSTDALSHTGFGASDPHQIPAALRTLPHSSSSNSFVRKMFSRGSVFRAEDCLSVLVKRLQFQGRLFLNQNGFNQNLNCMQQLTRCPLQSRVNGYGGKLTGGATLVKSTRRHRQHQASATHKCDTQDVGLLCS